MSEPAITFTVVIVLAAATLVWLFFTLVRNLEKSIEKHAETAEITADEIAAELTGAEAAAPESAGTEPAGADLTDTDPTAAETTAAETIEPPHTQKETH